jgi:hypothetical protein
MLPVQLAPASVCISVRSANGTVMAAEPPEPYNAISLPTRCVARREATRNRSPIRANPAQAGDAKPWVHGRFGRADCQAAEVSAIRVHGVDSLGALIGDRTYGAQDAASPLLGCNSPCTCNLRVCAPSTNGRGRFPRHGWARPAFIGGVRTGVAERASRAAARRIRTWLVRTHDCAAASRRPHLCLAA